jgi:oligoendopeptidase F
MIEGFSTPITDHETLGKFVKSLDQELYNRGIKYSECLWDTYLGKAQQDLNILEAQIAELLLDPDHLDTVRAWRGKTDDPKLERILDLFERALLSAQVASHADVYRLKNDINAEVIKFRPTVGGKTLERSDLRQLMRHEPNRQIRREGYYAEKPLHDTIVDRCIDLIRTRNSRARDLGFDNLTALELPLSDIEKHEILSVFQPLESDTRDIFYSFLDRARTQEGYEQIQPWDVAYLIQKQVSLPKQAFPRDRMVEWTLEMAQSLGFPKDEFSDIHIEFGDIPFGGVCFGIDPPKDIRVLLNPRDGHEYVKVLFHEFGHALQNRYVPEEYHIAKYDTGPPFDEGMAEFLEGIAEEKNWLSTHTDLSPEQIEQYRLARAIERISWLRSLMYSAIFEFEFITNPDQDLDILSHNLIKQYVVPPPEPTPRWAAAQSILITHPIYVYSYILADCLAAQLRRRLGGPDGELFGDKNIAPYLIETCYSPGGYVSWRDKVKNASGYDVRVNDLLGELLASSHQRI